MAHLINLAIDLTTKSSGGGLQSKWSLQRESVQLMQTREQAIEKINK